MAEITEDEVCAALKRMKNGKAVGPNDLPVKAWRNLEEMAVKFLTKLFNKILTSKGNARMEKCAGTNIQK